MNYTPSSAISAAPRRTAHAGLILAAVPLCFLTLFYFYPLAKILLLGLTPVELALTALGRVFSSSLYLKVIWFTCWQAAVSVLLTLFAGLPLAYVMARFSFPGRRLIQTLITVPFVLPTVVTAAAFQALLGPRGLVNDGLVLLFGFSAPPIQIDQTIWFILLAHLFYNVTVVVRIVGGFWSSLAPDTAEAARMLGASPRQAFFKITLPLLKPAILAAGLLVFIFCFSSFGVILILGGPRFATLEVEIYRQAVHLFNLPLAAVLSVLQIVCTLVMMGVYTRLQHKHAVTLFPVASRVIRRPPTKFGDRVLLGVTLSLAALILGGPMLALLAKSVATAQGISLDYYAALFHNPVRSIFFVPPVAAILYSLGFALLTLLLALAVGLPAAVFLAGGRASDGGSRGTGKLAAFLDPLFMLPLSTSAVTLGFGFIIALDKPPLNLRTSLWLVPLAHTLVAFPFVVRSLLPVLRSIPGALREAATMLGASPRQVWFSVDLPIAARALTVGAVFAFTVSLGEFGATVFTARPQTPTMPLAIYRFLGQPGALNFGQAMAMSSILMLVTAAGFLVIERLRAPWHRSTGSL